MLRSSAPAAVKGPYSSSTWQTDLGNIPPPPGLLPPSVSASPPLHERQMSPHLHPSGPGGVLEQGGPAGSPPPGPRAATQDVRAVGLPPPPPPQQLQHPRLDPSNGLHVSGSPVELHGSLGSPVSSRGYDGRPPLQAGLPGLPLPGMDALSMAQSASMVDAYQQRPVRSPTRAHAGLGGGGLSGVGSSSSYEQPMLQAALASSAFDAHTLHSTGSLPTLGVPASLDMRLQAADAMNGRSPAVSSSTYDGQAAAGMGTVMPGIPAMLQQSPVQQPPPPQQQQQAQQQQQQPQGGGLYSIPHSAYDSFAAAGTLAQPPGGSGRMSPPPRRAASVAHLYDERMAMLEHDAAAAASFFNSGGSGAMPTTASASFGSLGLEHQSSAVAQQLAAAQQHMAQLAHVRTYVPLSQSWAGSSI